MSVPPTDAGAGGTCIEICKKTNNQRASEVAAAKTALQTKKGEIEESMMTTKAALMEQSHYLQNLQGVWDQLQMLKEFKSSFVARNGNNEYNETVCDLLRELSIMKKHKRMGTMGGAAASSANSTSGSFATESSLF